jgi:hypothetical protein
VITSETFLVMTPIMRERHGPAQRDTPRADRTISAEMQAVALCGMGQPDVAEQRLTEAIAARIPGDRRQPRGLSDLLSEPRLPGISRIGAIANY